MGIVSPSSEKCVHLRTNAERCVQMWKESCLALKNETATIGLLGNDCGRLLVPR